MVAAPCLLISQLIEGEHPVGHAHDHEPEPAHGAHVHVDAHQGGGEIACHGVGAREKKGTQEESQGEIDEARLYEEAHHIGHGVDFIA